MNPIALHEHLRPRAATTFLNLRQCIAYRFSYARNKIDKPRTVRPSIHIFMSSILFVGGRQSAIPKVHLRACSSRNVNSHLTNNKAQTPPRKRTEPERHLDSGTLPPTQCKTPAGSFRKQRGLIE